MSVPNQKIVKVIKEPCNKEKIYAMINIDAFSAAMKDLSGEEFKIWCYFSKNQQGYEMELSPKAVIDYTGTSAKSYQRSIAKMIEKGYLVNVGGNRYIFNEIPQKDAKEETGHFDQTNQAKMTTRISNYPSQNDYRNITYNNTVNTTVAKIEQPAAILSQRELTQSQEKKFIF